MEVPPPLAEKFKTVRPIDFEPKTHNVKVSDRETGHTLSIRPHRLYEYPLYTSEVRDSRTYYSLNLK